MRSIVEQVDQFIEEFFDGRIMSVLQRDVDLKGSVPAVFHAGSEDFIKILGEKVDTFLKALPQYISAKPEDRGKLATTMFENVLYLRWLGMIQNNPNNLRELDFYKIKVKSIEGELTDRDEHILRLMKTVRDLQAGGHAIS